MKNTSLPFRLSVGLSSCDLRVLSLRVVTFRRSETDVVCLSVRLSRSSVIIDDPSSLQGTNGRHVVPTFLLTV